MYAIQDTHLCVFEPWKKNCTGLLVLCKEKKWWKRLYLCNLRILAWTFLCHENPTVIALCMKIKINWIAWIHWKRWTFANSKHGIINYIFNDATCRSWRLQNFTKNESKFRDKIRIEVFLDFHLIGCFSRWLIIN